MSGTKIPVSVQVVSRNNMPGIKACLDSLKDFDEVIVQDGYSTDGTREEARQYSNVTLMDQNREYLDDEGRIRDFSGMRNESIRAAKHDWVLVVDADEGIQHDLREEVRSIVSEDRKGVYVAFRRFFVDGEKIMHSSAYPALQIRFFHRSLIVGYEKPIHERIRLNPGVHTQMLQSELPVPLPPAKDLREKHHRYLMMETKRASRLSFFGWCKWVLLRNLGSTIAYLLRLAWVWVIPRNGKRLPLSYEFQFVGHSLRTIIHTFPPLAHFRKLPLSVRQFATYLFTGGTAAAIDIGTYVVLFHLGLYYVTASVISGSLGFVSAFLLHKHVAFRKHEQSWNHVIRFLLLGAWNLFATNVILFACVQYLGLPEEVAKVLSNASVVLWNFFLYKFLVYV